MRNETVLADDLGEDDDFEVPQRTVRDKKGKSLACVLDDYTVIDLETTGLDPTYDDIIEIGALKIREGKIVAELSQLVKPPYGIPDFITNLTGISNEMVATAPSVSEVLPYVFEFVGDDIVVGHNVNFDINFLYDATLQNFQEHYFSNDFVDTMRLARRIFPEFPHHTLYDLVHQFNLENTHAHRSLSDCQATYQCYEYIKHFIIENHLDVFELFKSHKNKLRAADISSENSKYDTSHPLYGKVCVFTGTLSITRKAAMQLVANVGGINGDNVTAKTNFLIVGNFEYFSGVKNGKSCKMKKAESLILKGQELQIISENVFFDLLENLMKN